MERYENLAQQLAGLYRQYSQVEAVALSGSLASGATPDGATDIDLYVFTTAVIPLDARLALVEAAGGASRANMNVDYWDQGDAWFHAPSGIEVDCMYWDTGWVDEMLDRVVFHHQPSLGYSTAHWHTLRSARPLFDRDGWLARLQQRAAAPYPDPLRQAVIARNHAVLRAAIPAYQRQIEKAVLRGDLISVNHRLAALLASYFDVLFAYNRVLHPGEKRLLEQAARLCHRLPEHMDEDVQAVLRAGGTGESAFLVHLQRLLDRLDDMLGSEKPLLPF